MTTRSTIIPGLRYQDAPAAIDFLCDAFGFHRHAVYADDADPSIIHHAQLTLEGGMVMLGSARFDANPYGWKTARELGGVTTCICVVVADADAHHDNAKAAGAEIIVPPHDNDGYPGRGYDARDPEGNVWSMGTYDPWADHD